MSSARADVSASPVHIRATPQIDKRITTAILKRIRCYVRFSNPPVWVKRFQTIHRCLVDVACGLRVLFGIGTERRLHSVDNPTLLADEALALAVGAFGILVLLMWGSRQPCSDHARRAASREKRVFSQDPS